MTRIPVYSLPDRLAVTDGELATMLGLTGRPVSAQKRTVKAIANQHGIRRLPGGVWPLAKFVKATGGVA